MNFKSILKPDASVMASAATVGLVYGVYQLNAGSVMSAQATDANHPILETSRKKAGYTALVLVAGLTLLTKDANIGILGSGTIIAMEISYRHAIMAHPVSGDLIPPGHSAYEPVTADMVPDHVPDEYAHDFGSDGAYR